MIVGKISKKGQIVIPKEIRDQMGLKVGDVLSFKIQSNKVVIEKLTNNSTKTMFEILENSKPIENSIKFQRKLREEWD
jgi:AbrB family looped-hinge helix DNA binding protein